MSTISSISSAASSPTATPTVPAAVSQKTLGQNDFLKLLAQQFQSQDPMKPMDDTGFIAQMAQFTSLQQTSDMTKSLAAMQADSQRTVANSYLGHRVTVDDGNGNTDTGDVSAIDSSGSAPQLIVNGNTYPLSAVLRVEPGALSTTTPGQ
jgi:flagellar basal-body rod modification protein FlgD